MERDQIADIIPRRARGGEPASRKDQMSPLDTDQMLEMRGILVSKNDAGHDKGPASLLDERAAR